jgi:hypothetical protein
LLSFSALQLILPRPELRYTAAANHMDTSFDNNLLAKDATDTRILAFDYDADVTKLLGAISQNNLAAMQKLCFVIWPLYEMILRRYHCQLIILSKLMTSVRKTAL